MRLGSGSVPAGIVRGDLRARANKSSGGRRKRRRRTAQLTPETAPTYGLRLQGADMVRAAGWRSRLRSGGLGLGLALLACRPAPPSAPPADTVQRFYAAVATGDCAGARATLSSELRTRLAADGTCDHLFHELRPHPLERVIDTQVDGRNRAAQLVRIRLRGHATAVIIRVQAEGREWKIFSL